MYLKPPLTDAELDVLRAEYPTTPADKLARKMRRSRDQILATARQLGLKKIRRHTKSTTTTLPVVDDDPAMAIAKTFRFVGTRLGGRTLIRCQISTRQQLETRVLTNDDGNPIDVFDWGGGLYANATANEQKELLFALHLLIAVARRCNWDSTERPIAECYAAFRLEVVQYLPRREFTLYAADILRWLRREKTGREIVGRVSADDED